MSRKRALKKRADYRGGGYVDRKKFFSGGISSLLSGDYTYNKTTNRWIDKTGQEYAVGGPGQGFVPWQGDKSTTTTAAPTASKQDESGSIQSDPVSEGGGGGGNNTATANNPSLDAKNYQNGGAIKQTTDRTFGARTTDQAPAVEIRTNLTDPNIQTADEDVQQIAERTTTATPEDATDIQIQAAQGTTAQAQQQTPIAAAQMTAAQAGDLATTEAAQGQVTREAQAEGPTLTERAVAAERDATQEQAALVQDPTLEVGQDAFVQRVIGEQTDVVQTTPAEKQQREATIGMPAPSATEAQIINEFGFGSSKNRVLRGPEAKQAAAGRLVSEHGISQEVANSILEDVGELVTNVDGISQESLGAIASLPKEALVSSQMESLLAGMEDGKTPTWARPAVAAIEAKLAERGLEASSVGRDALFNSIIQSALPIAQSNAQALQQRASQNLSNEQQALIQDRQIASDFLGKNAAFKQQMDIANLTNDQQMRLANLSALNQAGSENLSAAQQSELADLNARLQTNTLQAKLASEMGVAQLSVDQQTAMNNASLNANIDFTKYTTAQQNALANSKFMQTMTMADFNARQQSAMQNATTMASMDLATADQNTKLAITNAQNFLQMDMANLTNEQQGLIMDQQLMQQRLLSDQAAANAASQFNATSDNQTNQFMAGLAQQIETFNATQFDVMTKFNATEVNRMSAINAANDLDADKFNSQQQQQVTLYDQELEFKTDQWNAQNAQVIEQSNIAWRRKANTMDTAAQNEANKIASQMSFKMSQSEQNFLWQQMRDAEAFAQQNQLTQKERTMQILSSIYGNAELMTYKRYSYARDTLAPRLEAELF